MKIDCSLGEGGGSIVRISVALASALNIPLELYNIRSGRRNPGLKEQHIKAIKTIAILSGNEITGLELGSSHIKLEPTIDRKNEAEIKINTAGSIALLIQALKYYSLIRTENLELKINGGATHGKWAPSIEYLNNVTGKYLKDIGKKMKIDVEKYGFYPKGGAKIFVYFYKHTQLSPLVLEEKGELERIEVYSIVSSFLKSRNVAKRQIDSFIKHANPSVKISKTLKYVDSFSPGTGLTALSYYENGSVMGSFIPGERKLSSEEVGRRCAEKWLNFDRSTAALDEYVADQLIVPLSLIKNSKSTITTNKLTKHTETNIELIKKFVDVHISTKKETNHYKIEINTQ